MFHNEKLRSIHKESKQIINEYHNELDKLNEDIKTLENILQDSGIEEFEIEFSKDKHLSFTQGKLKYIDISINRIFQNRIPLLEYESIVKMQVAPQLANFFELCIKQLKSGIKNINDCKH